MTKKRNNSSADNLRQNSAQFMADGGQEPEDTDDSKPSQAENEENTGLISSFKDKIGIGSDHVLPRDSVASELSKESDIENAEELAEELEDFDNIVNSFDSTRSELEADIQATAQAYETTISEDASAVASRLNSALSVARSEVEHVYDFNPERGLFSLDYSGPENPSISAEFEFDSEKGLRTFLSNSSRIGDTAFNQFSNLQEDMAELVGERENLKQDLEAKKERNEDQLENSRSSFTNEDEKLNAELIRDGETEADIEEINDELSQVNEQLLRKRPRKEDYLEIGNNVLGEVESEYKAHANFVEESVRDISEELGYLTDSLDKLTSVEIGSMESMLQDMFKNTDVDLGTTGKYLNDAEGDVKEAYREAVNDLTVKVAKQYAQGQKAIKELETIEDSIERNTDRLDLGYSDDVRNILEESYSGEDFEEYLQESVSGILDATFNARDEIRNVFRGLEELRDEEQLES